MDHSRESDSSTRARLFHLWFVLALALCGGLITLAIVVALAPENAVRASFIHDWRTQTAGVALLTGVTWIVLRAPRNVQTAGTSNIAFLDAIEKRMLIATPWLAPGLVWISGFAFFTLMRGAEHVHQPAATTLIKAQEEPAIFLMALIAIYVAVEHLNRLQEHRELMDEYNRGLESLANASGLAHGKAKIYSAYRNSKEEIVAVIRMFDIDLEWFEVNGNLQEYCSHHNASTFYQAFPTAQGARFVANLDMPMFRSHMPHPLSATMETTLARQFHNLLGLAWQYRILKERERVGRQNGKSHAFQILVASTFHWIHVADNRVFQLSSGRLGDTTVRDLTFDLEKHPELLKSLLDWAKREIELAAEGGCSGEEFLCTTLLSHPVLRNFTVTASLNRPTLKTILDDLGMQEWIVRKGSFVEGLTAPNPIPELRCLEIFEAFLQVATAEQRAALTLSRSISQQLPDLRNAAANDEICPILYLAREVA